MVRRDPTGNVPTGNAPPALHLSNPWGVVTRTLTLAGLIAMGLLLWAQFTFESRWVTRFVVHNELDLPQRMTLIKAELAAFFAGALLASLVLGLVRWRRGKAALAAVERWMWFLSPLALAPAVPLLMRYKPWKDRYDELLPVVLALVLVLELTLYRSLGATPEGLRRAWGWVARKAPGICKRNAPLFVVMLAGAGYAAFMGYYTVLWHLKLKTHNYDLSISNNLTWGAMNGVFMECAIAFPDDPKKYLSAHASFGQYVLLPLYALRPRPETLLFLESCFLGGAAVPLYLFARRHVTRWMAAATALCFLMYYPMQGANFYEVKYNVIACFFVFCTFLAADAKRWLWFILSFACALLMREDLAIGLAVAGAWLLLSGYRPKAGLFMAFVASLYFAYLRFHVMENAGKWWFPNMYKDLWAPGETGFKSVLKTLLSNPLFAFQNIIQKEKIIYLLHLFVPLAFIPVRRAWLWAGFFSGTILTLLTTNYKPTIGFSFQYVMHWAQYLFLSVPLALASMGRAADGKLRMRAAVGAMLVASVVLTYNYGAFPRRNTFQGGFSKIEFEISDGEKQRYRDLMEIIKVIPKDATVSATENVGPHVSSRRTIYAMRDGPMDADYVLASSKELGLSKTRPKLKKAVEDGSYGVLVRRADFAVLKKGHPTDGNAALLAEWKI